MTTTYCRRCGVCKEHHTGGINSCPEFEAFPEPAKQGFVEVGGYESKTVSVLNHYLYSKAIEMLEDGNIQGCEHYGKKGVSAFVNWLEENFNVTEKVKK